MISGKVALGKLSLEFGDSEEQAKARSRELREMTARAESLAAEERELIDKLVRLYVPALKPTSIRTAIQELDAGMEKIVAERGEYRRKLAERLEQMPSVIAERTGRVSALEAEEDRSAAVLDAARAAVEEHLGRDARYPGHVAEHHTVMERRSILGSRRTRLLSTANVERYNYEADPTFAYLQARRFAEPEYQAGFITRRLDAWLARRVDYETLVRNYRVLRTGPHAIEAERRRLTARAEELESQIDALEGEADERFGLLRALETEGAIQARLEEAREALEEATARRDAYAAEARDVEAGLGGPHQQAIRLHRDFVEAAGSAELRRLAEETPDPRDDDLIQKLDQVRGWLERAEQERGVKAAEVARLNRNTTSFGELARKAARHFTSRRSQFPEDFSLGKLVGSILDGQATSQEALADLEEVHVLEPVLEPSSQEVVEGWFAELSSLFDPGMGAVEVRSARSGDVEHDITIYDAQGRVVHRRVTRRDFSHILDHL